MTATSLRGSLLVAQPLLTDANFARTVVLLLEHSDDGAVGVVLNRPSQFQVAAALSQWAHLAATPGVVFVGGPVVADGAGICLARTRAPLPEEVFKPLTGTVGTLDVSGEPSEVGGPIEEIRLFAGYAGWEAGQLEGEISGGGWFVVEARTLDAFSSDPDGLWKAVLGRQRGELAWFVNFPPDVALN
ncbi:MAG: YqgE/AlgH family protein [Candidatus Dormibacteria bacterium]